MQNLTTAELNHLRLLLAWVSCEIGQTPEQVIEIVKSIAPAFENGISDDAKQRLVESYQRAQAAPLYIRAAVKALRKTLARNEEVIPIVTIQELPAPTRTISESL